MQSIIGFLPALIIGYLLVVSLWETPGDFRYVITKATIGIPVGIGVSFCVFFTYTILCGVPNRNTWVGIQISVLLLLILFRYTKYWRYHTRPLKLPTVARPHLTMQNLLTFLLILLLLVILASAAVDFIRLSQLNPHGRYDAWAGWNLNARMVFRDPSNWKNIFSTILYVPDYPILVPFTTTQVWIFNGVENYRIPIVFAALCCLAIAGLLCTAVSSLRGLQQGLLATIVLCSSPWLINYATPQIADVPLAMYILAVIVCIAFYFFSHANNGLLILIGFLTGCAAWVKNEGLLFMVIVFALFSLGALFPKRKSLDRKAWLWFLSGLLIPVLLILYFKITLTPVNHFAAQRFDILFSELIDADRWQAIILSIFSIIVGFGGWQLPLFFMLLLFGLFFFDRDLFVGEKRAPCFILIGLILCQFLGYFFTYLVTPFPVQWHIDRSFSRIMVHIYPAIIFFFFFSTRSINKLIFNK